MDTFDVKIDLQISATNLDDLARVAHPMLLELAEHDANIRTELGEGATPQQVADFYSHNPETVISALVRAMLGHGLVPFNGALTIGANSVSSHKR